MKTRIRRSIADRFTFRNFSPKPDLETTINSKLGSFSGLALDEATISGFFERLGIGYRCRLQAISIHGQIFSEALANDPHSAVARLEKRIDDALPQLK